MSAKLAGNLSVRLATNLFTSPLKARSYCAVGWDSMLHSDFFARSDLKWLTQKEVVYFSEGTGYNNILDNLKV